MIGSIGTALISDIETDLISDTETIVPVRALLDLSCSPSPSFPLQIRNNGASPPQGPGINILLLKARLILERIKMLIQNNPGPRGGRDSILAKS